MDDTKKSKNLEKVGVTKNQICLSIIAIFFVGWLFSTDTPTVETVGFLSTEKSLLKL